MWNSTGMKTKLSSFNRAYIARTNFSSSSAPVLRVACIHSVMTLHRNPNLFLWVFSYNKMDLAQSQFIKKSGHSVKLYFKLIFMLSLSNHRSKRIHFCNTDKARDREFEICWSCDNLQLILTSPAAPPPKRTSIIGTVLSNGKDNKSPSGRVTMWHMNQIRKQQ